MSTPGALCCSDCDGTLVLNSVPMNTFAWCATNLIDLWSPMPALRGNNVTIPGAAGKVIRNKRVDETKYSIRLAITGAVNQAGTPYSDHFLGLQTNITYLQENVMIPIADGDIISYTASLTLPDSSVLTADIQPITFRIGNRAGPLLLALLEIAIPAGRFA